mmetsp:Transcript_18314/g.32586  ORF Transcript_18314/g.32586 Transcript_18314/m.32586 type:complete len:124 (-) Transcript_18314:112-483(-)
MVCDDEPWANAQALVEMVKASDASSVMKFLFEVKSVSEDKEEYKKMSRGSMIFGAFHAVFAVAIEPFTIPRWTTFLDPGPDKVSGNFTDASATVMTPATPHSGVVTCSSVVSKSSAEKWEVTS